MVNFDCREACEWLRCVDWRRTKAVPSLLKLQTVTPFRLRTLYLVDVSAAVPEEHAAEALFPDSAFVAHFVLTDMVPRLFRCAEDLFHCRLSPFCGRAIPIRMYFGCEVTHRRCWYRLRVWPL